MITYIQGNLFDANVEALVNTVNTVGVSGKGLAKQFKERYPENAKAYTAACEEKQVAPGKMFITENNDMFSPRWIINFPTKKHWRGRSRLEWIEDGLSDLRVFLIQNNVRSVAIPPLGAGLGGLSWPVVCDLIEWALRDLTHTRILIYEPIKEDQLVNRYIPVEEVNPTDAIIAKLVRDYALSGHDCTRREIKHLIWFLRSSLNYHRQHDLRPGIFNLSPGHDPLKNLYLKAEKSLYTGQEQGTIVFDTTKKELIDYWLTDEGSRWSRALEWVSDITEGFETTCDLELLAWVDWLVSRRPYARTPSAVRMQLQDIENCTPCLGLYDDKALQVVIDRVLAFHSRNPP